MIEKQELHCHNCNKYVQFEIDLELNGNHVLECPNCGHEHCRVVKDGKITSDRWDSRNSDDYNVTTMTYSITGATYSNYSTWTTYNNSSTTTSYSADLSNQYFLYQSWMNSGS